MMRRRMDGRPQKTYVNIMRVRVKAISMLHGQHKTWTIITLQAKIHIHLRSSQPFYNMFLPYEIKIAITNLDNQMKRSMIEKVKVPNNSEMDTFKRIFSNTHGHIFSMHWPTYTDRPPRYSQIPKSKIRRNGGSQK